MKSILIIGLIVLCNFLVDCKKENPKTYSASLVGEWSWIKSCGGIAGICYTPESTKSNSKIVFTPDSTYRFYRNDTLKISSCFSVNRNLSIDNVQSATITYCFSSVQQTIKISHDTLFLDDGCCDGFSNSYKRVKY